MSINSSKNLVRWFRAAAPYIHIHKNNTFVITFDASLMGSANFIGFVHDLNLLLSLGIKIVLVYGAQREISRTMQQRKITQQYVRHHKVVDKEILSIAQDVFGRVRLELEARLSTSLPNSPMEGSNIRVSSGNFVFARPLGIIDGVDTLFSGETRKVDGKAIGDRLDNREIVLLSSTGFSSTGEIFCLSQEELATKTAVSLKAGKLIFLGKPIELTDKKNRPVKEVFTNNFDTIIKDNDLDEESQFTLRSAALACESGVDRAHIINGTEDEALIVELFTHKGLGILITKNPTESIRKALPADSAAILELIKPLQDEEILSPRSEVELEEIIPNFIVLEHDQMLVGCAALNCFPDLNMGELACLAVHPVYRNIGAGKTLLTSIQEIGRKNNLSKLFVLTTQSTHWFIQQGFIPGSVTDLPPVKQERYNKSRKPKSLFKTI